MAVSPYAGSGVYRALEGFDFAMLTIEHSGRIVSWNQQSESLLGWKAEEVIGRLCSEVLVCRDTQRLELCDGGCLLDAVESGSEGTRRQVTLRTKSGAEAKVFLSCAPQKDEGGQPDGAVIVLFQTDAATSPPGGNGKVCSVLAHDLRNPITALIGYVDMLLEGYEGYLNKGQQEFVSEVRTAANRLADLITEFLEDEKMRAAAIQGTDFDSGAPGTQGTVESD